MTVESKGTSHLWQYACGRIFCSVYQSIFYDTDFFSPLFFFLLNSSVRRAKILLKTAILAMRCR